MGQNGTPKAPAMSLQDVLLQETLNHLMTMLDGFGLRLPPGQKIEVAGERFTITIQPRLIVLGSNLVVPGGAAR